MLDPTGHLDRSPQRLRLTLALLTSLALHFVLLAYGLPELMSNPETERLRTLECPGLCASDEPDEIAYELQILPPEPEEVAMAEPEPEPQPVQEPEEEAEEERAEPEPVPEDYYMVDLQTRDEDEPPDETQYLAPVNMRTEEEVQAEVTTLLEVDPGQERSAASPAEESIPEPEAEEVLEDEVREDTPEEQVALAAPPEDASAEAVEPTEEIARAEPQPVADPNDLGPGDRPRLDLSAFNPSMRSYQRSPAAANDRQSRERIARQMAYEGYLHHDDQAEWERMRATLENMVPEIRTGTETRLNARRHEYAGYVSYVHRRIHALWANDYLMSLDLRFDPSDPLSNPNLQTTLEIVISRTGEIARINIVRSSGQTMYDGEAISIVNRIGPLRPPPSVIMSDNGNAYIRWNFWRDQRQCGTFGASVHRVR